jgi:hypothetical protein
MTPDRPAQVNLAAAALLACASLFAVYRWHYGAELHASQQLGLLSDSLRAETENAAQRPVTVGTAGATVPELLSLIQQAAAAHNVSIRSVAPSPVNPDKITLGLHGDFRDLMGLLGRLETFQIQINAFEFEPDESGGVTGSVEIQHSAKPGAPSSFADYLDAIVQYSAVRNPFEIGDPIPLPNMGSDLGDLSWTYQLTSISLYGAERIATIDGKDYRIGDHLNNMQIIGIGPSSVSLSAPHQPLVQKLHFRHNPGEAQDAH